MLILQHIISSISALCENEKGEGCGCFAAQMCCCLLSLLPAIGDNTTSMKMHLKCFRQNLSFGYCQHPGGWRDRQKHQNDTLKLNCL